MSDPTNLHHYMNFPVCGFCTNAWDIVYGRMRSTTSPARFVEWCRVGGCDPDIWDFIDDGTGWPVGWKLSKHTGLPLCYKDPKKWPLEIPEYDNRVYHRRKNDDPGAPWRKIMISLHNRQAKVKSESNKPTAFEDIEWDDDEADDEDLFGPNGDDAVEHAASSEKPKKSEKKVKSTSLLDDDIW